MRALKIAFPRHLMLPAQHHNVLVTTSTLVFNITLHIISSSYPLSPEPFCTPHLRRHRWEKEGLMLQWFPVLSTWPNPTFACEEQSGCSHKGFSESYWIHSSQSVRFTIKKNLNRPQAFAQETFSNLKREKC